MSEYPHARVYPRERDVQRARVYRAEARAFKGADTLDDESDAPSLGGIANVELTLDECHYLAERACKWAAKHDHYYPIVSVDITDGRGRRRGGATRGGKRGEIALPRFARRAWYVLHEVAHLIDRGRGGTHGPSFTVAYVHLVDEFLGSECARRLSVEFDREGVR